MTSLHKFPGFPGGRVAPPGYHSPQACPACRGPIAIPTAFVSGALLCCVVCAHIATAYPDAAGRWTVYNLTREQAADVRAHPNFPNIRRMQDRIIAENYLIG